MNRAFTVLFPDEGRGEKTVTVVGEQLEYLPSEAHEGQQGVVEVLNEEGEIVAIFPLARIHGIFEGGKPIRDAHPLD